MAPLMASPYWARAAGHRSEGNSRILFSLQLSSGVLFEVTVLLSYSQEMCNQAMADLDSTEPPLFLRFVNLLVNDAHFLLDEALDVSHLPLLL